VKSKNSAGVVSGKFSNLLILFVFDAILILILFLRRNPRKFSKEIMDQDTW
jgi:hypothetical protein